MKILVIAHFQNDGSPTASFVHDQIKQFRKEGNEVLVIVPIAFLKPDFNKNRVSGIISEITVDGIRHIFVRYLSLSRYGEGHFNSMAAIASIKHNVKKIIEDFSPTIIHAHTIGLDSSIGMWLKSITGCPLIITTHGSDLIIPIREGKASQVRKNVIAADAIVCVSTILKKKLKDIGVNTRTVVIFNGFTPISYLGIRKKRHSVNQTGSLIKRKKTDVTIKAISLLEKKYPDIRLSIVGEGPERDNLELLCKELKLQDKVTFKGQLSNIEAQNEMMESQFFVMPSTGEGFGIVYLEAMSAGCITIGTKGEGIADVIQSGANGFLVEKDSPQEVYKVIDWCIDNAAEANLISERGIQTARKYSWESNCESYLGLFRELANRASSIGEKKIASPNTEENE